MEIEIQDVGEMECATDALILPLCENEKLPYREIDATLSGVLSGVIGSKEFEGKRNQVTLVHTMGRMRPERILLVGLGKREDVSPERVRQAGGRALQYLPGAGCSDAAITAASFSSYGSSPVAFIEGGLLGSYKFRKYKSSGDNDRELQRLKVLGKPDREMGEALRWVEATSSAVCFARDLINTPANDMTPTVLAEVAQNMAKEGIEITVLEREDAEREGMGAYLSVSRGSMEPPKFIILRYEWGKGEPIALIGKSITFDSGGISIKPSEGMEKMKYDMAGGAAVLGVMQAVAALKLPVNVLALLPATENLPSGTASRPGDIVKTVSGKTIEIISTDAEGRMALADAIGYVKKYNPRVIIDIATLTGACSIAFGNEAIAMMGNDDSAMERLKVIGDEVHERVWQMPLYEEYLEYIKSDVADLKNSGGRGGSLVTAGYFLKEFAGDTPWVHLDIAGAAWVEKERPYVPKGATGVGVRLLSRFMKESI